MEPLATHTFDTEHTLLHSASFHNPNDWIYIVSARITPESSGFHKLEHSISK